MAQKRMFDKTVIDSDDFLELPITSQALYFHLNMRADDDGFVDNWKSILRIVGAKEDDIKILIAKSYIIPFESGVIVIKHWRINNYLQKDRKKNTRHIEELQSLKEVNGEYYLLENGEITNILLLDEEREKPEWQIKRDNAYKESSLPYSFLYKIRNAFNETECPICHSIMRINGIKRFIPTIQHLIPINKGGEHELYNIAIICNSCNASIRDKIINDKLNNEEVIKKWQEISASLNTRSTSANIDKNRIDKNSIDNNIYSRDESNESLDNFSKLVIDYLNSRAGTKYSPYTKSTIKCIKERINESKKLVKAGKRQSEYKFDDFVQVIENKVQDWKNTSYEMYLRPSTLFGSKFDEYLNQKDKSQPKWFDKNYKKEQVSKEEEDKMNQMMEKYK